MKMNILKHSGTYWPFAMTIPIKVEILPFKWKMEKIHAIAKMEVLYVTEQKKNI